MEIIIAPESLRAKLGEDGLKELVELINNSAKKAKEEAIEAASRTLEARNAETRASLEKLILETKAEIIREVAAAESRLFWKVLGFLAGQTALLILVMRALIKGTI